MRHSEWDFKQLLSNVLVLQKAYHFEHHFSRVIAEGTRPSQYQAAALQLALDGMSLEILRECTDRETTASSIVMHPAVSRALNLLQTRFRENWSLGRLAGEAGISRSRLAELFREQVGNPVHKSLNKIRVEHAQTLLEHSDLTINAISEDCGFATSQHFARIFRSFTGTSAAEYRQSGAPTEAEPAEVKLPCIHSSRKSICESKTLQSLSTFSGGEL